MRRTAVLILVMLLLSRLSLQATDTYIVHLLHTNGLEVVKVESPDGTKSSLITSLSVQKGDMITFVIDNAFTPAWKYSNQVADTPFKLSDAETKALKDLGELVTLVRSRGTFNANVASNNVNVNLLSSHSLDGSTTMKPLDSLRMRIAMLESFVDSVKTAAEVVPSMNATIESMWSRQLTRLDSIPFLRTSYDKRRVESKHPLTNDYYDYVRDLVKSVRDTLAQVDKLLEQTAVIAGHELFYPWVSDVLKRHVDRIESETKATAGTTSWTVVADGDEQVVTIYARDRRDTSRVDSLQLRLKIAYPRSAFSLDPTLAVLILQKGSQAYSVSTDSSGKASLTDTTSSSGVYLRPAVQFTCWALNFGPQSSWSFGPSIYFGYAHDFVFDIGATLTLAYREVAQLSIGYVSASIPQSVSGEIQADTPMLENAVLNYARVGSVAICLSIRGISATP